MAYFGFLFTNESKNILTICFLQFLYIFIQMNHLGKLWWA